MSSEEMYQPGKSNAMLIIRMFQLDDQLFRTEHVADRSKIWTSNTCNNLLLHTLNKK